MYINSFSHSNPVTQAATVIIHMFQMQRFRQGKSSGSPDVRGGDVEGRSCSANSVKKGTVSGTQLVGQTGPGRVTAGVVYNVNEPPELHPEARRSRQVGVLLLLYRKHSSSAEEGRKRLVGRGELGGY